MNNSTDEWLRKLIELSPMLGDAQLTELQIQNYIDIIQELSLADDTRLDVIRPLIYSFGYGEVNGAYWPTLHLIERFDQAQVDSELMAALQQGAPGARMWSALMLGRGQTQASIPILIQHLLDPYELVRVNCVNALVMIDLDQSLDAIKHLKSDPSEAVRKVVKEVIEEANQSF